MSNEPQKQYTDKELKRIKFRKEHYLAACSEFRKAKFDIRLYLEDGMNLRNIKEYTNKFNEIINACENYYTDAYKAYNAKLTIAATANVPQYYLMAVEVPCAVKLKLGNTLTIKQKNNSLSTNIYIMRIPVELETGNITSKLKALKATVDKEISITLDLYTFYEINDIPLNDTKFLDSDLLAVLEQVNAEVEIFKASKKGSLKYFTLLPNPNYSQYRIGKNLLKNLSFNEPISKRKLSNESYNRAAELSIDNVGINLSLKEKRVLEGVLTFATNSTVVYSTENPKGKEFKISKENFKKIIKDKNLKTNNIISDILCEMSKKTFVIEKSVTDVNRTIQIMTPLFLFKESEEVYYFVLSDFLLSEIVAVKGKGFYVERKNSFYQDTVISKYHKAFDYFCYRKASKNSNNKNNREIKFDTVVKRLGLIKYLKHFGKPKTCTKINEILLKAKEQHFIKDFVAASKDKSTIILDI